MAADSRPPPEILEAFRIGDGAVRQLSVGHINTTYVVDADTGPATVIQGINTAIFSDPERLMTNALQTADALRAAGQRPLRYLHSAEGSYVVSDGAGQPWRAYEYVAGDVFLTPLALDDVRAVGRAFGAFDAALAASGARWHPVLQGFHDQVRRSRDFHEVHEADPAHRRAGATADTERLVGLLGELGDLESYAAVDETPVRVVHHDAKAANVVRQAHGPTMTVIDLDTVMPGSITSDVGELVRSCGRENIGGVPGTQFVVDRGVAVVRGFLEGWGSELDAAEAAALPVAGLLMTIQNATRFLTDYLAGDTYFHVDSPKENLDRFRAMATYAEDQLRCFDEFGSQLGLRP